MTMLELSKEYGVHPTQIGTWKRAAIKNMAAGLSKRGSDPAQVDDAAIDKLHSKIAQLVVERDFLERARDL
jgi:transposase